VRFVVEGAPRTKKTSNRVVRAGKRLRVLPSAQHQAWAESAILQLRAQYRTAAREHFVPPRWNGEPADVPMKLRATVYRDANRGDLIGYLQAICDALEKAGVVENDRLIEAFDGSRQLVDRARPRVEIELTAL